MEKMVSKRTVFEHITVIESLCRGIYINYDKLELVQSIYSSINSVQIAAEWDKKPKDSDEYKSQAKNLEKLQETKKELEKKQKVVDGIEEEIKSVQDKIKMIAEDVNINSNFSPDSLDRLSLFLREDEYTDDCFLITDIDTDSDIINTQKELLV